VPVVPIEVGLNVMLIVQLAPAARLAPQVVVRANSVELVPPSAMTLIVSGAVPVLDNVTVLGALVTFNGELNACVAGETVATGTRTVPVRDTD